MKPKPRQSFSQRASVTFPNSDWEQSQCNSLDPNSELNADITSLEHMHSVSELDDGKDSETTSVRGSRVSLPPRLASLTKEVSLLLDPYDAHHLLHHSLSMLVVLHCPSLSPP